MTGNWYDSSFSSSSMWGELLSESSLLPWAWVLLLLWYQCTTGFRFFWHCFVFRMEAGLLEGFTQRLVWFAFSSKSSVCF